MSNSTPEYIKRREYQFFKDRLGKDVTNIIYSLAYNCNSLCCKNDNFSMVNKCIECDYYYCTYHMEETCFKCHKWCICCLCCNEIIDMMFENIPCDNLKTDEILCHKCNDELLDCAF